MRCQCLVRPLRTSILGDWHSLLQLQSLMPTQYGSACNEMYMYFINLNASLLGNLCVKL